LTSSIYPIPATTSVTVSSIAVNIGGSGYTSVPTVTIDAPPSGTTATATAILTLDVVTSIVVNDPGTGYTSVPTVTIDAPPSGTTATATATLSTISNFTDILSSDIVIIPDHVSPGGGGILRISFSFAFNSSPAIVSIRNNDALKGNLNSNNSGEIISNGYYRFDIDVEDGDAINIQSEEQIDSINFLRAHLVQFGA
jgi:hypothetical protein